jgi:hypothetical protein
MGLELRTRRRDAKLRRGMRQIPEGIGCVLRSTKREATISLSATGSRKAPNLEVVFCVGGSGTHVI